MTKQALLKTFVEIVGGLIGAILGFAAAALLESAYEQARGLELAGGELLVIPLVTIPLGALIGKNVRPTYHAAIAHLPGSNNPRQSA